MRTLLLTLATAVLATPVAHATIPAVGDCQIGLWTQSGDGWKHAECDIVSTGTRGTLSVSGYGSIYGYVACSRSGDSATITGGTTPFVVTPGELCQVNVYAMDDAYALGHGYTTLV
jgi:hypothetical protein